MSRGLPDRARTSPLTQVMDVLTEPDTSGTPVTSDVQDSQGSSDVRVLSGTPDTSVTQDTRGTSGISGARGASAKRPPALRDHVKLRRDLANQMRDAVWFLAAHGRPRVQLGEILDEAVEAWLAEAKKSFNDGADFPHKGRLR